MFILSMKFRLSEMTRENIGSNESRKCVSAPRAKMQQLNDSTYFVSTSSSEYGPNCRRLVLRHNSYRNNKRIYPSILVSIKVSPPLVNVSNSLAQCTCVLWLIQNMRHSPQAFDFVLCVVVLFILKLIHTVDIEK